MSTGQTLSAACNFQNLITIADAGKFTLDQVYDVTTDSRIEKVVTNVLTGIDLLTDDCQSRFFTFLDWRAPDGTWITISDEMFIEDDVEEDNFYVSMYDHMLEYNRFGVGLIRRKSFTYFAMNITESIFRGSCQFEYDTEDRIINIPLRIAYQDAETVLFATEFVLTVNGPDKEPPCAGMTLDVLSTARSNYQFSFPASTDVMDELKNFEIQNALKTSIADPSTISSECLPKYKLSIEWPAGTWIAWKKLKETINAPVNDVLPDVMLDGALEFDDWSGNFYASFYSSDREVIENRFFDGVDVKIRCKVEAFLPGKAGALA
jgi:hypothetical protein